MVARRPSSKSVCLGPAQLVAQRRRVDRVAQVVADAVGDVVEVVGVAAHQLQDRAHHGQVVPLAVGADQIRAPDLAVGEDAPHRAVVVVDVDPVPHVGAGAIELGPPGQHVGDLARDELLHVLVRPVVVGAVRDRRGHPVGPHPRAHQHVGAALVDEYGLDGLYGVDSVNRCGLSSARSPYTSSVETWCSRTPCRRTASSIVNVPMTLACRNGSGIGQRVVDVGSAAKCTTASASATSLHTNSASVMSPCTSRMSRRRPGPSDSAATRIGQRIEHRHRRPRAHAQRRARSWRR